MSCGPIDGEALAYLSEENRVLPVTEHERTRESPRVVRTRVRVLADVGRLGSLHAPFVGESSASASWARKGTRETTQELLRITALFSERPEGAFRCGHDRADRSITTSARRNGRFG